VCDDAIGYEKRFYSNASDTCVVGVKRLVHATCYEDVQGMRP
jgi:hypothetical protein